MPGKIIHILKLNFNFILILAVNQASRKTIVSNEVKRHLSGIRNRFVGELGTCSDQVFPPRAIYCTVSWIVSE
jgi:hypothetical protein